MSPSSLSDVSFEVGGAARLTLLDASSADINAVSRQLGVYAGPQSPSADVVVQYQACLEPGGGLHHVELGRFGFTPGRFWWLRGLGGRRVRVTLDPSALEVPVQLTCERKGRGIPLLTQILAAITASKGTVAVHAAAFHLRGQNVLVAGWSHAGKTETLLAAISLGGKVIGDDIVYLEADSGLMWGLPQAISLHAWHLEDLPKIRRRLPLGARLRLRPSRLSAHAARRLAAGPGETRRDWLTSKGAEVLTRALSVSTDLRHVANLDLVGTDGLRLSHVVLVMNSSCSRLTLERSDPLKVAARVQQSLADERSNLIAAYRQMRFAFPGARSALLDRVDEREARGLEMAFQRGRVWQLTHPYPVEIGHLASALNEIVKA